MSATRTKTTYQEGCVQRATRAKGPDVWVYRWREADANGRRVHRKKVIGDVAQYPTYADAKRAADPLRIEVNAAHERAGRRTVRDAWEHFLANEMNNPEIDRSPTTIEVYQDNFRLHILPRWGETYLTEVKPVQVESWLRGLTLARATKSKLRNNLSVLFSHAIRHEMYDRINPIAAVRQSSKREKIPDILTLDEMVAIVSGLDSPAHRLMVCIAAVTALRRSEIRGLKWKDVDTERLWMHLRRGKVRKHETKLKTGRAARV
jgi:integrase